MSVKNIEGVTTRVAICSSHQDRLLRARLYKHLAMLRRAGDIEICHDAAADLILLLVSADFLDSDQCYNIEARGALQQQRAHGARVIPVILRPCDWRTTLFGKLPAAPADGRPITTWRNRDEAWLNVVGTLKRVLAASGCARAMGRALRTGHGFSP
jgi:hypothetical protein